MRRRWFVLLGAGALSALAVPAAAHAMLERASPVAGAILHASPTQLQLRFSERVERALCTISLADAAGRAKALGPFGVAGDGFILSAPINTALAPGVYRVHWRAVSVDTHVTSGDFSFRVAP